ncbi:MAG: cupin domain-containing protein [Planctomycetota bacterium]|jgi:quercetin dioxygenase-like cupin family protein
MATHHASPSEIVDLETWAQDLPNEHAKAIVKTPEMELARLVFPAGGEFPNHKVSGPIVVHCIKGEIEFVATGITRILKTGQLVYLLPDEPHSVRAIEDAVVLLTIIFKA